MFKYRVRMETGYVGADYEETFEYKEEPTYKELTDDIDQWVHENIQVTYELITEETGE